MKIFISHSHQDKWFADRLVARLKKLDLDAWYDTFELCIGDNLLEKIHAGLNECSHLIVILSRHSIQSQWVKEELYTFYHDYVAGKKAKIYPFLLDPVWDKAPAFLKKYLYADFRNSTRSRLNPAGLKAITREFHGDPVFAGKHLKCYRTPSECRIVATMPEGKSKTEVNQILLAELRKLRPKVAGQKAFITGPMTNSLALMAGAHLGNICRELWAYDPKAPDVLVPVFLPGAAGKTAAKVKKIKRF
ncbi:TIR domain-containing protein [bacterium]|nr:TIR domain-containing protein [bacterium]